MVRNTLVCLTLVTVLCCACLAAFMALLRDMTKIPAENIPNNLERYVHARRETFKQSAPKAAAQSKVTNKRSPTADSPPDFQEAPQTEHFWGVGDPYLNPLALPASGSTQRFVDDFLDRLHQAETVADPFRRKRIYEHLDLEILKLERKEQLNPVIVQWTRRELKEARHRSFSGGTP